MSLALRVGIAMLLCAWASGCRGDLATSNRSASGGAEREVADDASRRLQGETVGEGVGKACPDEVPLSVVRRVRRLSRVEYLNAVADLLPGLSPTHIAAWVHLPPDATRDGFENQSQLQQPSALWLEEVEAAAVALAAAVVRAQGVAALLACEPGQAEDDCVAAFVARFGSRAFRRPLAAGELAEYLALYTEVRAAVDHEAAVELLLQAFLQSPHFLYRAERSGDDFELASRVAFLIWQAPPDAELLSLAAEGRLQDEEVRRSQILRLLADTRAETTFGDFQRQWLELEGLLGREKDRSVFPSWSSESARAALDESAWLAGQALRGTLGAGTLADLLGSPAAAPRPGSPIAHLPTERAGVLTRPAFLALHARSMYGSPPLRGLAVSRQLLCQDIPAPPADADLSEPVAVPGDGATNRQRFAARTSPARCAGCHAAADAIGFAFEHYDAIGGYRTTDNGVPVDARGMLVGAGSADGPVTDAIELSHRLAVSEVVAQCFVRKFFQFAEGRPPDARDACRLRWLQSRFLASGGKLADLILDVARADLRFASAGEDQP